MHTHIKDSYKNVKGYIKMDMGGGIQLGGLGRGEEDSDGGLGSLILFICAVQHVDIYLYVHVDTLLKF